MTSPNNGTVGDIVTRLEFSLSSDALDFQRTGKGVLVVDDNQASLPLPAGPRGPVGHLTKDDKAFLDDRSDAAASSAAAAKTSETNAKSSETKAKTSETNAKSSETKAKTSETNAKSSETKAKTSETNAKSSETKAKTSEEASASSATASAESASAADLAKSGAEDAADLAITAAATVTQYVGDGFPEGKVTAPVGSIYVDRLATAGALRWIKVSGTGSTGWRVEYGDTGWRDITDGITSTVLAMGTGAKVLIRRKLYDLEVVFVGPITHAASWGSIWGTSRGFRPERESETALGENARLRLGTYNARIENATRDSTLVASGRSLFATLPSEIDWPSSLPGTPE